MIKNVAVALLQVAVALGVASSVACNTTKPASKSASIPKAQDSLPPELAALQGAGPLYFDTDSDTLTGPSQVLLQRVAHQLHRNTATTVVIAGHADERGDTGYNLALSERRGHAARAFLERLGVHSSRVRVVPFGEEQPAASGHSEETWSQNRRDEFLFVLPGEAQTMRFVPVTGSF